MAVAVSTDVFRKQLADWLMDALPGAKMAFGSGGVDSQGQVISPDPAQTGLAQPAGEFVLHHYERTGDTVIQVTGRISQGDLTGIPLSEAGLKVGGELFAVRNFFPKTFEDDEFFDVTIEIKF